MSTEVIVALIAAGTAVLTALITAISNGIAVNKKIKDIAKHEKENYLSLLRLTVMSEEMPDSERIIAGSKYLAAGGNGEVKKFYLKFIKSHTINGN